MTVKLRWARYTLSLSDGRVAKGKNCKTVVDREVNAVKENKVMLGR
jgi:hypothetical protein